MVNDDSNIEVPATKHELSKSVAENHFDRTTFEFGASGNIEGVTVGGNAGFVVENESGQASSFKSVQATLAITYIIPRVTICLRPEDLEPTEEFAQAAARVREMKDLFELRKLHKLFGQLFCCEIVLGGCLSTPKTLTTIEQANVSMTRSKFKGSVGLIVGLPGVASGFMEASHGNQDQEEEGQRTLNQQENFTFTATGGSTIWAADAPSWLSSVASDFNTWRLIQQLQMKPLMEVVSAIPKYEEIQTWFLQAVPKLTEYIVVPQSRLIDTRLKVMFQLEGLSRALTSLRVGIDNVESRDEDRGLSKSKDNRDIQTYLAHNHKQPPTFIRTFSKQIEHEPDVKRADILWWEGGKAIIDVTTKIFQTTETTANAFVQPASTQAPVLIDPRSLAAETCTANDTPSGNLATGAVAVEKRTAWRMEVPYGYSLTHNSLVDTKSMANPSKSSLSLTVYGNAPGAFMPTITSDSHLVYWRVEKATPYAGGPDANQFKYGDSVRLCWRFSD
ncbi:unnamed protein product [Alternaria sp. RS040]